MAYYIHDQDGKALRIVRSKERASVAFSNRQLSILTFTTWEAAYTFWQSVGHHVDGKASIDVLPSQIAHCEGDSSEVGHPK